MKHCSGTKDTPFQRQTGAVNENHRKDSRPQFDTTGYCLFNYSTRETVIYFKARPSPLITVVNNKKNNNEKHKYLVGPSDG